MCWLQKMFIYKFPHLFIMCMLKPSFVCHFLNNNHCYWHEFVFEHQNFRFSSSQKLWFCRKRCIWGARRVMCVLPKLIFNHNSGINTTWCTITNCFHNICPSISHISSSETYNVMIISINYISNTKNKHFLCTFNKFNHE